MKYSLAKLFKRKLPKPKSVDEHLAEIEERLVRELALAKDQESGDSWSNEDINTCILSLEKLDELREKRAKRKKRSFLNSPAGASILTAIITITATQIPAFIQQQIAFEAEESNRLTPIFEIIAQDKSLSLDEKIKVINFVSSSSYRYETVSDFLENYRFEIKRRNESKLGINDLEDNATSNKNPNKANSADAKNRAAD